jgi:hypothetical protein
VSVSASMWAATDIGPGKAAISDFVLVRRPERNLLALSYNVLALCSYSFDPKALLFNTLTDQRTFPLILEG